jgi:hypothetical protein
MKKLLPSHYFLLLRSYLSNRSFVVKVNNETSKRYPIHSSVPQGSLLSPFLCTLYTHDLPTSHKTLIGTLADDTAIFATHDNPATATTNLQDHLILIEKWLSKWKFKVNETKSIQTTFTLRKGRCPPIQLNHSIVQQKDQTKYLGLIFDSKLNWKHHIVT